MKRAIFKLLLYTMPKLTCDALTVQHNGRTMKLHLLIREEENFSPDYMPNTLGIARVHRQNLQLLRAVSVQKNPALCWRDSFLWARLKNNNIINQHVMW